MPTPARAHLGTVTATATRDAYRENETVTEHQLGQWPLTLEQALDEISRIEQAHWTRCAKRLMRGYDAAPRNSIHQTEPGVPRTPKRL